MTPDDALVVRGDDGVWYYNDSSIPAVGAKDRTLAEVVQVRELGVRGAPPDAVVLSLSEIVADSRLNWALQAGTQLSGGGEDLFLVPWPTWEEHASETVDVWLPERDARGVGRRMAIAERSLRFHREALETATARRSQLVLLGSELGMTRRQIADVLGLSVGRVQQLYEEVDGRHVKLVRQTIEDARLILRQDGDALRPDEIDLPPGWTPEQLDDVIARLLDFGLVEAVEGDELQVTEAGRRVGDGPVTVSRGRQSRVGARTDA